MTDLDRLLHGVVGRLAHDLKNPLAAVSSNLSYLREEVRDPALLEAVQESALSLERALRIVDDAVDLGRLRAKQLTLALSPLALSELAEPLRAAVAPHLGRRTLRVALPDARLLVDRDLLLRALINILEHALRHTPGSRAVELDHEAHEGAVTLRVSDGGLPFAPGSTPSIIAAELPTGDPPAGACRSDQGLSLGFAGWVVRTLGGVVSVGPRADGQPGVLFELRFPAELAA